jgi:HEAT repeat protein
MSDAIGDLQRRLQRRFGSTPAAQYEFIARDFQKLVDNGLKSGHDLSAMALDAALDPAIRSIACWFLARLMPRRVSTPTLMTRLAESPTRVRAEAIHSLGIIKSKQALPILVDLALYAPVTMVRESSIYALGLLQDERGLDTLLTIAQNGDEAPKLRGLAIEQLGIVGVARPDVIRALTSLLDHEHVEVAFWAIYALGNLGSEAVVPTLERVARSDTRALQPFGTLRHEASEAVEMILSREELRGVRERQQS